MLENNNILVNKIDKRPQLPATDRDYYTFFRFHLLQ